MIDPSYTAALTRLHDFLPKAGHAYASQRNYDRPGHADVSLLSPYLRHRIIDEETVLQSTLARHSAQAAEKFIQEVFWRTYWKGWLEMRPGVWTHYQSDLRAALNSLQTQSGLRAEWEAACKGDTGIDCFDHWARELVETGYLHNHARMWFASIWIFTLRLPWVLGADFFMRHLLDGDPASNTLSWRWVGGLQTVGKTYLARPDNIAKYTDGRFRPRDLASFAVPLDGPPAPPLQATPVSDPLDPALPTGLLVTEEDLSPSLLFGQITPKATAFTLSLEGRSPLTVSTQVVDFTAAASRAAEERFAPKLGPVSRPDDLVGWAKDNGLRQIVTSYPPVGPVADRLAKIAPDLAAAGIQLSRQIRPYDARAWPFATKGFFKFKEKIPSLLAQLT